MILRDKGKRNKQRDQWGGVLLIIIATIITIATRSGGKPGKQSHIQTQRKDQFCLDLSKEISGTVQYKRSIYQDCKGD